MDDDRTWHSDLLEKEPQQKGLQPHRDGTRDIARVAFDERNHLQRILPVETDRFALAYKPGAMIVCISGSPH
ncbi:MULTISPECIES: hypothetical protein [unclassified Beijerinckia]|uniref:hypothetical protein n=1 Tax=unclassified Beijerinckia TaxID=2638183 RepID=UPI001115039D|nr:MULTISPECIES: hypothetical protein [unclassified Beijerinckia]MDH7798412.1 hypothetical protein [Beijerinckia sp. GAS462]